PAAPSAQGVARLRPRTSDAGRRRRRSGQGRLRLEGLQVPGRAVRAVGPQDLGPARGAAGGRRRAVLGRGVPRGDGPIRCPGDARVEPVDRGRAGELVIAPVQSFDLTGPLPSGTTLLEASAGTGKTFTVA